MYRIALRGLLAHRARLLATTLAVVLGVGFVAGTYVLTDTLRAAITGIVGQSQRNIAVVVQGRSATAKYDKGQFGNAGITIASSTLARVLRVEGVASADAVAFGPVEVYNSQGKQLGGHTSLSLVLSVGSVAQLRSLSLVKGRFPTARSSDQAVIDAYSASRFHIGVGQEIKVAGVARSQDMAVVGIVEYGSAKSLAGATIVGVSLPAAQKLLGQPGRIFEVVASGASGVPPSTLAKRVRNALGPSYEVQTQSQAIAAATATIDNGFSVFGDVLLLFAGVALFVALFLIFNTFSILLAQRSKELALLRCIGANRTQILSSVMLEALSVGVFASSIGLGLGVLLALGLRDLLSYFGVSFPPTAPVVEPRTVVISLLAGTFATIVAATLPAVRTARISPLAAFREEPAVDLARTTLARLVIGVLLALAGAVIVAIALHDAGAASQAGAGASTSAHGGSASAAGVGGNSAARRAEMAALGLGVGFVGVVALVPMAVSPIVRAIGWPFATLRGVPGLLGRRNAMRHPRRTAATASALVIGLVLVTTIAVFAQSVEVSTDASLSSNIFAPVVVSSSGIQGFGPQVGRALLGARGIASVATLMRGHAYLDTPGLHPTQVRVGGTELASYVRDVNVPVVAGSFAKLSDNSVAVTTGVASAYHLKVGSLLDLTAAQSGEHRFEVGAIYRDPSGLTGDLLMTAAVFSAVFPGSSSQATLVLATASPGLSAQAALDSTARSLRGFPQAQVFSKAGYIANQTKQIQELVSIITALLVLSVLIALFGIVNTLALSVVERTREIGVLRALGMSRRQLRASIRYESIIVALFATVLGIVLGVTFGWVVVDSLRSAGVSEFSLPIGELLAFVVVASLAGVVAAVVPARSAAKIDVLAAIADE